MVEQEFDGELGNVDREAKCIGAFNAKMSYLINNCNRNTIQRIVVNQTLATSKYLALGT